MTSYSCKRKRKKCYDGNSQNQSPNRSVVVVEKIFVFIFVSVKAYRQQIDDPPKHISNREKVSCNVTRRLVRNPPNYAYATNNKLSKTYPFIARIKPVSAKQSKKQAQQSSYGKILRIMRCCSFSDFKHIFTSSLYYRKQFRYYITVPVLYASWYGCLGAGRGEGAGRSRSSEFELEFRVGVGERSSQLLNH